MDHHDIAHALTDVSNELLLEAERPVAKRRAISLRRIAAAAAIIAMLTVTAGAVSAGITWSRSRETAGEVTQKFGAIYEDYYQTEDGILDFEKLELTLPLEVVELPEQNMEKLSALTGHLDDGDVDFYVQNHMGHYTVPEIPFYSFGTLTDVETMLGITLDVPDALRKAIEAEPESGNSMVWVRIYARASEPQKVEISFQLTGYATNGQVTGSITVPLTDEAAQEGMLVESYSYALEGAIWQEEQTVGGYTVNLYGNDPQEGYDGSAGAVYTSGGIGYHISTHRSADKPYYFPGWPCYDSAKEMLLSLLDGAE